MLWATPTCKKHDSGRILADRIREEHHRDEMYVNRVSP